MDIDRTSYPKYKLRIGTGYDRRPNGASPCSQIVHTTNGQRGSSFEAECRFIYSSAGIGAHYAVGKRGQIVEFLPPELRAWHAGAAVADFINTWSIGVECHLTPGEAWTQEMRDALTWLTRDYLMPRYGYSAAMVETHRRVALPAGRKIDPSEWSDRDFYAWRAALAGLAYVPTLPRLRTFVVTTEANVREAPKVVQPWPGNIALGGTCVLPVGFVFQSDVVVKGQALDSGDQWAHVVQPAAWGFVHTSCIREAA